MLKRTRHHKIVRNLLRDFPVVGILGARQVGKTTLAKQISDGFGTPVERFDLEDPADLARLDDPGLALADLRGLIVIDEIQRRPDLFPVLRVSMLAHYHGQTWNASAFARSFGVTDKTVNHYLDVLTSSLVVRTLPPWHANLRKRQVKAPKVYLRDPGILHALLGIRDKRDLERHPKLGASWEGFVLDQLIQRLGAAPEECHFWATHAGAELDLFWMRGRKRYGFEIKRTSAPKLTRSLQTAIDDLGLQKAFIMHAGEKTFPLSKKVTAVAADRILIDLEVGR